MFLIRNKNYLSLIFILLIILSCTIPSLANKRLMAQTEELNVFFEDFSNVSEPEIGNKFVKEGKDNFWGTVKSGDQNILWSDYLNAPYLDNVNNSVTSDEIDLSSPYISSANLSLNVACDTEPRTSRWTDYVTIDFFDGKKWQEAGRFDETLLGDEYYHAQNFDLNGYLNNEFKFKLTWNTNSRNNEHLGCSFWPFQINLVEDLPYLSGTLEIDPTIGTETNQNNILIHPLSNRGNKMRFSSDNNSWTEWIDYSNNYTFDLTDVKYGGNNKNEFKIIFAQFKDIFGVVSESSQASVLYDTAPPSGTISLLSGDAKTNSKTIKLKLDSDDNIHTSLSNDGAKWSDWAVWPKHFDWDFSDILTGGNDAEGEKQIFYRLRDNAGNISQTKTVQFKYELDKNSSPNQTIADNNPNDASPSSGDQIAATLSNAERTGTISDPPTAVDQENAVTEEIEPQTQISENGMSQRQEIIGPVVSKNENVDEKKLKEKIVDFLSKKISSISDFFHKIGKYIADAVTNNDQQLNDQGTINLP